MSNQTAVKFCMHGVAGGACGFGTCINHNKCVCDVGYQHDSGWFYYPNCFVPTYFYPALYIFTGVIFVFVILYGFYVRRFLQLNHPLAKTHLQLTNITIAFSILWTLLIVVHAIQGYWGILCHVNALALTFIGAQLAVPIVHLYFFPVYKYVRAPITAIKRFMTISFWVCYLASLGTFIEANRTIDFRFAMLHDQSDLHEDDPLMKALSKWNDMIALNIFVLALLFFIAFAGLNYSNRKALMLLTKLQSEQMSDELYRQEFRPNEQQTYNDQHQDPSIVNATSLLNQFRDDNREDHSQIAKLHLNNLLYFRRFFEPILVQTFLSCASISLCHFASGGIFRYQYLVFMLAVAPTPFGCLLLFTIAKSGGTNLSEAVSRQRLARNTQQLTEGRRRDDSGATGVSLPPNILGRVRAIVVS
jgi:hypothetical protein